MTTKTSLKKTDQKNLAYYMALSYPMELHEDEDGFTASCPDLPGCISYGDSPDDAIKRLKITKKLWIEGKLEAGLSIPLPAQLPEFSGKFVLRIPRDLHRALHFEASRQGVSLNQYVGHVIADRHKNNRIETSEIVANISAGIGRAVANQKSQYSHQSFNWAPTFFWDGINANLEHVGHLTKPSDSIDYVLHEPGRHGKSVYSEPHVRLLTAESLR